MSGIADYVPGSTPSMASSVPSRARLGTSSTGVARPQQMRLGNYMLGETIGHGSFGKVKLATHSLTGHRVAIKILNKKKLIQLRMEEKMRREIEIMQQFRHPHIVKLYEVIDTSTDIFMVIEYINGGELFDFILTRGRLSEDVARRFFQQLIAGVEYCHAHRCVHRDLKPENLLIQDGKFVKIADFGLSNIMLDGDPLKTSCGSPNYAAPEVISGQLYAGPEVDVWSCGIILYAMLCASLPFDDDYIPHLFKKIKSGQYTMPKYLSPSCRDLIKRILVVDPTQRIDITNIRKHPWFLVDLPEYLVAPPQPNRFKGIANPDEEIILTLVDKFGVDYQGIVDQLTCASLAEGLPANNDYIVAYRLIHDHLHEPAAAAQAAAISASASQPTSPPLSAVGSPPSSSSSSSLVVGTPSVGVGHHLDLAPNESSLLLQNAPGGSLHAWALGISSSHPPRAIMREVFEVLRQRGFVWKVAPQCKLFAIKKDLVPSNTIRLALQLFKVTENSYILDFRYFDGQTCLWMDEVAIILLELQQSIANVDQLAEIRKFQG